IDALSKKNIGMTRQGLLSNKNVVGGSSLTKMLRELEQCRFIRKYRDYTQEKNGCIYQIIDPFILLNIKIINKKHTTSWVDFMGTPAYYAWRGNAFEILVLNHIDRIKSALGISGVSTMEYAWKSKESDTKKAIRLTLISANGLAHNENYHMVQNLIIGEELFV
ncbi:MAG: hypothetical protein II915_06910, partial [Eubacterium sp.]|nr:hypothetical protein [Eubacterium sp.]